ncbi:MAG: sigma-54 interaction domain-containing protein [Nitrospiraceae bacterium]
MQTLASELIGTSKSFMQAVGTIPLVSSSNATVLISGETGTGKELFARAIHYMGTRKGEPFVPINCAALPEHLIENELFGHCKGAFTGASHQHRGLLAEADRGTLFLDEINSFSVSMQAKLLRVLQDREYRPLGATKSRAIDVRIVAATNRDLKDLVKLQQFREDLYHRLNVLSIIIPPLRERIEDIPLLAQHFLGLYVPQYGRSPIRLSTAAQRKLASYDWPGNVRELEGVIQRAVVICSTDILLAEEIDLPNTGMEHSLDERFQEQMGPETEHVRKILGFQQMKGRVIERFERSYLSELLATHQGNISQAARAARKERRSFQRLLQKYGLDRQAFTAGLAPEAEIPHSHRRAS